MYIRSLRKPTKSFLLLGPRGTGKSTWLKTQSFSLIIDLLKTKDRLAYLQDPGLLDTQTKHLKPNDWVLIDEVQKVPELLDEVHAIYESRRIHFALCGSSARKLKKSGVNLLAGRAINCRMYPLIFSEYSSSKYSQDDLIDWGTLPLVMDNFEHREDTLATYIDNYLRQELVEEGIIRNLEPFVRFLTVAGQLNGQVLNVENIARESHVKRPTVDKYFQVLYDTLIGYKLPAYQPNVRTNEAAHSKFYFFDSGVARAAAGLTFEPLEDSYRGFLFETLLLNEVRAYNDYHRRRRDLFYYAIRGAGDIDLIVQLQKKTKTTPDRILAIEFKLGKRWRPEWAKALKTLSDTPKKTKVEKMIIVYRGDHLETHDEIVLMPVRQFLEELHSGNIF